MAQSSAQDVGEAVPYEGIVAFATHSIFDIGVDRLQVQRNCLCLRRRIQGIVACAAGPYRIGRIINQQIVAGFAVEAVVARQTVEDVVACAAPQYIDQAAPCQRVVPAAPPAVFQIVEKAQVHWRRYSRRIPRISPLAAGHYCISIIIDQHIIPVAAIETIRACTAVQRVVPCPAIDAITSGAADQNVVQAVPTERVVAAAPCGVFHIAETVQVQPHGR